LYKNGAGQLQKPAPAFCAWFLMPERKEKYTATKPIFDWKEYTDVDDERDMLNMFEMKIWIPCPRLGRAKCCGKCRHYCID